MGKVIIIVAVGSNGAIGKGNTIPWRQQKDMQRFKKLTTNNTVIMGRKTFESLGKPLPNRVNIVLTNDLSYKAEGVYIVYSPEEAILIARVLSPDGDYYVIGGSQIYKLFMGCANFMFITAVHTFIPDADAFFPDYDKGMWVEVGRDDSLADENNEHSCTYYDFTRATTPPMKV